MHIDHITEQIGNIAYCKTTLSTITPDSADTQVTGTQTKGTEPDKHKSYYTVMAGNSTRFVFVQTKICININSIMLLVQESEEMSNTITHVTTVTAAVTTIAMPCQLLSLYLLLQF